jgi:outer membrane protein assembly factor BamB
VGDDAVYVGNQDGEFVCLSLKEGVKKWSFKTQGGIFSSPAFSKDRIVFGSADGFIYCLNKKGKISWKLKTDGPVLGSPVIDSNIVYIGGSDHCFRAIELETGQPVWKSCILNGPVVSKPLLHEGKVIFGAWDTYLYALDKSTGHTLWKWNNGSSIRNYSPAACIPVVRDSIIFIVAPDRYITAIHAKEGKTLWRNNDALVRESIGISEDKKWVYGKTMQDTIVAYISSSEKQQAAWKMNCGFGYEHVPSMLIEKEGKVFFGTRNGVLYCIDPLKRNIIWAYKIDHSMVNTVHVISGNKVIASTMDGSVVYLEYK